MLVLLIERSCWVHSCMDEEALPVIVERWQRTQPSNVLWRNIDRACYAVAVEGRSPTIYQPIGLVRFVVDRRQQ